MASRGLKVLPSGRPGRGRLYVNLPDGRAVAWYDRRANRISVLADERREEILTALRPYLTGTVAIGPPPVPTAEDLLRLSLPPDEDLAPNRPGRRSSAPSRTAPRAPAPGTGSARSSR